MMLKLTKTNISKKGGEMMRTLGLVFAIMALMAGACSAATVTVTIDTYEGWNQIALPCVPINPAVDQVFSGYEMMFTGVLYRFDGPAQTQLQYDPFDVPGNFGNMLLGDGYVFYYPEAGTITYEAIPDGVPDASNNMTDMWISLPGGQNDGEDAGGWHVIGHPFNHDVAIDPNFELNGSNIKFTDGTTLKTWGEAYEAGWVDLQAWAFDATTQSQYNTGYFFADDDHFRAGKGYYIRTFKDNLAMIIPAY